MNRKGIVMIGMATVWFASLSGLVISAQDKYTVKVPGGLAFAEFRDTKTGRWSRFTTPKT